MPTILTKKSDTPGSIPATANLTNAAGGAELAVNTADKRLFTINSTSQVVELGTNPSSITCADGSFTVARIGSGTVTQLTSTSATITTLTATSATVTNLTATSLVISNLSVASMNITTLTSASATITNLVNTSASITTLTNNPTFGAGTANGVLYLNGSKVATSGSALTFDGTTLGVNTGVVAGTALSLTGNYVASGSVAFINFQRVGGAVAGTLGYDDANIAIRFGTTTNHSTIFLQNNSEAMRLTSTGLGIGTSSPAYKLDVNGTGYIANIQFTNPSAFLSNSADALIGWASSFSGYTNGTLILQPRSSTATPIVFATGATTASERMRITDAGDVGIGTSSPGTKLDVYNSQASGISEIARFRWNNGGTGGAITWTNQVGTVLGQVANISETGGVGLGFYTYGNSTALGERLRLDASGNLGLGVTPSAWGSVFKALQISGGSFAAGAYSDVGTHVSGNAFYDGTNWKYIATDEASNYYQQNGAHAWRTAASGTAGSTITWTQAMTLDADGDLSLGTTSPTAFISGDETTLTIKGKATSYASAITLINNAGTITAGYGVGNTVGAYFGTSSNHPVLFQTNGTERARITSGGDFGIGTSSPGARLSVTNSNATSPTFEMGGSQVREFVRTGAQSSDTTIRVDLTFTSQVNFWNSHVVEITLATSAGVSSTRYGGSVRYVVSSLDSGTGLQGPTALASDLTGLTVSTAISGMEFRVTFTTTTGNIDYYCVHARVISSGGNGVCTSMAIN